MERELHAAPIADVSSAIVNAMTVDVEDYFQVEAFASLVRRDEWPSLPCRVERNVELILEIFDEAGIQATFFTLAWIARRFPQTVRRIVAAGHELASHGTLHRRVFELRADEFRRDIRESKNVLEDVGGVQVNGYRAPSFSIVERSRWAFDVLGDEGFAYSSSVFPIHHDLYGWPDAPREPFRPSVTSPLLEIPMTTVRLLGKNMPCSGGGYFRLLPYGWTEWGIRHRNTAEATPAVFYFHPWELDPEQPRIRGASLKSRARHYTNLGRTEKRLRKLVRAFRWAPMRAVFAEELDQHVRH